MTSLFAQAFTQAAQLSEAEQDVLANRLLAEMAAEDDFDRALSATTHRMAALAEQALAEHRSGKTQELDPERL